MTPSLDISSHWWLVLVGWSVLVGNSSGGEALR